MLRNNIHFKIIIAGIIALGFALRLLHYDHLPAFNETADEFMYPWAGMSFLQTGMPVSWSGLPGYSNVESYTLWDVDFTMVAPWIHKPMLYPLITGSVMLVSGATEFHEVRLSVLRLIPIAFSTLSILLVAIAGTLLFNRAVGAMSALLYATIPTIAISGRLSLVENVIIPLSLLVIIICSGKYKRISENARPYILGALAATAILLKQTGIFIPIACAAYYLLNRRFREASIVVLVSSIGALIYLGFGWGYVGLQEFIQLNTDYEYHTAGLPRLFSVIFQYPMIVNRLTLFVDPYILAGYILLFSSPWWLKKLKNIQEFSAIHMFILLPFTYMLVMLLAQSGGSRFYGWHFYPFFPFISILLAVLWYKLYVRGTFLQIVGMFILLSPAVAWLLKMLPPLKPHWQYVMLFLIMTVSAIGYNQEKLRRVGLMMIFALLVIINIFIIFNAPNLLLTEVQPPASI